MALRMFTNKVANVLAKQYGDRVRYELMQVGRSLPCVLFLEGSSLVVSSTFPRACVRIMYTCCVFFML
jgi:hypothetical protein